MMVFEENKREDSLFIKVFTNLQYLVLFGLLVGQCVVGVNFYMGQFIYLAVNTLAVVRCFVLGRPVPDKVKDFACAGVTLGLILFRYYM